MWGLMTNANQLKLCVMRFLGGGSDLTGAALQHPTVSPYLEHTNLIRYSGLKLLLFLHRD